MEKEGLSTRIMMFMKGSGSSDNGQEKESTNTQMEMSMTDSGPMI